MKRLAEFVLGLIGGIIFSIVGLVCLVLSATENARVYGFISGIDSTVMAVSAGAILLALALTGLFGAIIVRRRPTAGGILMLVSGVMGLASSGFPWSIFWSGELIVAGVMACIPKPDARQGLSVQ